MWPRPFIPQLPQDEMSCLNEENNTLRLQIDHLNGQVHTLSGQVNNLQVENARLRALLPPPPPQPSDRMYTAPSDNVLHLPVVIERLAVMRNHFQRQGTLKQCSQLYCNQYAFGQTCFRAGHMGWCRTHNRIVTGNWTSCSVKTEDRGDCISGWWEQRDDWADIVDRAYREGRIGHKGLRSTDLIALSFSTNYDPRQIGPPQGTYSHGHFQ
ncbi:hypothetical protein E8E11_000605 [Didymella keratinophila]|nr:hypothetical protein E8E11_000605 [Didymella keratinophila]